MWLRKVFVGSALALIGGLSGPAVFAQQAALKAFETSEFCKRYECRNPETWPLKDGGINHSYRLSVRPAVSFEAPTQRDAIKSYGLSFYERRTLASHELDMIWSLIRSVHPTGDAPNVRQFVQSHIEVRVPQILQAKTIVVGPYRLWVGKVGQEQILHIERDAPALEKPVFVQVGHQGMTYLVVVSVQQGAADNDLLAIARYLSNEEKRGGGRGEVHVWAWTDRRKAASRIPMTDAQADALIAQVHINPSKGVQRVERPKR